MLYVTTRNDRDSYTVQHALKNNRASDGGQYVPFHTPAFGKDEVASLLEQPFESCVAQVINRLLGKNLTGWDITFHTGRFPVRLKNLGYRVMIAESWHNPDWNYDRLVRNLSGLILDADNPPSLWMRIAVQISVFAGICCELNRSGIRQKVDFALVSGDFSASMAAWYARSWGFPIRNIICCCNENGDLWDLFANGQMRTDGVSVPTDTPEADMVIPDGLEQLIFACGGVDEVRRYVDACQQGKTYVPLDSVLNKLREGMYICVIGNQRMLETIPRIYASRRYLLSPYDALCYCGVSDYRARFGETGTVLIFSSKNPLCDADTMSAAMHISTDEIKKLL